jgi:hypothetical protein
MEPDPFDFGEQPHQEITEQSRRDPRQRYRQPELRRESRLTFVGDVGLFHRPAPRRDSPFDHWWRNAKAFTLGVALSHHGPLNAMTDTMVLPVDYQLSLSNKCQRRFETSMRVLSASP